MKYDKLVRDGIPEIIEASGKTCTVRVMDEAEYLRRLDEKLSEELAEYQADKSLEELADLLEVVRAIAAARGSSIEEVERIREKKAQERGGFAKKLLLTEVRREAETIRYDKLVRDGIPEIIERSGKKCAVRVMDDAEYLRRLDEKLSEELAEYQADKSLEELADLLEVVRAIAAARGSSIEEVERIRGKKAQERGGFAKKLLLTEVLEQ